jgi:predicted nucleic acid-binding protein
MHERAFSWMKNAKANAFESAVASHTLAELYAVLSTLPIKPRIVPSVAWRLIHENVETICEVVSLTAAEYRAAIKQMSELGLSGGIVYDALIAKAAKKAKVERLLTFNSDHFNRVWPSGEGVITTP